MRLHSPLQNDGGQRARHFREPILEFVKWQLVIPFFSKLVGKVTLIEQRRVVLESLTQPPFCQATGNALFCHCQPAATAAWCTSRCVCCLRPRFCHTLPLSVS